MSSSKTQTFRVAFFLFGALGPLQSWAQAIEEVIVTATRREESAQDVPIAISALSADAMKDVNISSAQSLTVAVPGLIVQQQAGGLTPFIRGVGSLDVSAGQESSIAMYIDGVFLPAAYGNIFNFNNVDRVEVLKGPQGTLFGRNASGGLIQVITRTPSTESSTFGSLAYGDYGALLGKFYATFGLQDDLAADVALVYLNQDEGFGRNITTGHDVGQKHEFLARTRWRYAPSDATEVNVAAMAVEATTSLGNNKQFLPGVVSPIDGTTTYTGDFQNITGGIDPKIPVQGGMVSLQFDHDFGPVSFKSISAYERLHADQDFDNDLVALQFIDVKIREQSYRTFTQEFQLLSNSEGAFKWIAGLFYMDDDAGFAGPLGLGLFGPPFAVGDPLFTNGVGIINRIATKSYAGFGEVTYAFTDATKLTLGARYTRDERELTGETKLLSGIDNPQTAFVQPTTTVKKDFEEPTYRAILDHRFSDAVMVYGSYSRGFKSGNFNTVNSADPPYKPEILDAYEIGAKTDLFDRRVRLNVAAFSYDYQDIQIGVAVGPTIKTVNATSADVKGGEIEMEAALSDALDLRLGFSYVDSKIGHFPNAVCVLPGVGQTTCDATGQDLPRAPKYTFNVAPTLKLPVFGGNFRGTVNYYYNDGFFWDFGHVRQEDSYGLLSASLGWTTADEKLGVRLYGENLTDEEYSIFTVAQGIGDSFAAAPPRTYAFEVNFNFK
jgi:iron complex outermembrane receptor protein